MAGHSKFKNIMHRKSAQDAKRAKLFTKIAREIEVAARLGGPDAAANPRLKTAIVAARKVSMPNDNINRAIKKAEGAGDGADYVEMRYEGYGPGGVAVIVEALTDNKNRTASEVRAAFSKHGGSLGETNSVAFMFDRVGLIVYAKDATDFDSLFEAAVEAGADNVEEGDEGLEVTCQPGDFAQVRDALEASVGEANSAELSWKPTTLAPVDEDKAQSVFKLIDVLEDNDDVQNVSANFDISDDVLQKLTA
ncbi:MAG: YebC/PmpR family DNA-binding transcriptional regulator [Alphaproteobacteria bacterium]|nr:YebC/PmpR family DNA-binding transcriptional regulator [Alphaproteobacteria bacterium]